MNRYPDLLSYLELFLKEPVTITWRGESLPPQGLEHVPASWYTALSGEISVPESVKRVWSLASSSAERFTEVLAARTQDLGLVASRSGSKIYGLLYVFQHQGSKAFSSWLGGFPSQRQDTLAFQQKFGITPPSSYVSFCSVHNGFTRDGWSSLGIKPMQEIFALEQSPEATGAHPRGEPVFLLAFCGDGAGNERCYDLSAPTGQDDFWTVDWDHETRNRSNPLFFWDFLDIFARREMG